MQDLSLQYPITLKPEEDTGAMRLWCKTSPILPRHGIPYYLVIEKEGTEKLIQAKSKMTMAPNEDCFALSHDLIFHEKVRVSSICYCCEVSIVKLIQEGFSVYLTEDCAKAILN